MKSAGFASRYLGMPYVFTNSWKAYVYLLVVKCVGAVGQLSGTFSIMACEREAEKEGEKVRRDSETERERDSERERESDVEQANTTGKNNSN